MEDLIEEIGKELLPSQAQETYQTLAKIFGNILDNPTEAKFRSLKKDNKVIAGKILRSNHAASLLLTIGFDDDGTTYSLPPDADFELLRTAHDLLQCLVLTFEDTTPAPQESAPPVAAAAAVGAAAVAAPAMNGAAGKPAVVDNPRGFNRRDDAEVKRQAQADQLQAARAAQRAQYQENPQGPPPPAAPAKQAAGYPTEAQHADPAKAKHVKPTAFDFKDRGKAEEEKNRAASSLEEIRKAQKDKFKDFQNDPNAKKQEAYKAPPSTVGGKADDSWGGWFGGMFGGGSSSNGSSGPSSKPQDRRGPRIKGVADLPKPPPRAGG